MRSPPGPGFTLIELLVVIAIIGMLASVVLASLSGARQKGLDARRLADLHNIQTALELYATSNGSTYPNTGGAWWSACSSWDSHGTSGANGYIPNLAPDYMSQLPTDPGMINPNVNCYIYRSDGTNYKLLDFNLTNTNVLSEPNLLDPARNYGLARPPGCSSTEATYTWAVWNTSTSMCW